MTPLVLFHHDKYFHLARSAKAAPRTKGAWPRTWSSWYSKLRRLNDAGKRKDKMLTKVAKLLQGDGAHGMSIYD